MQLIAWHATSRRVHWHVAHLPSRRVHYCYSPCATRVLGALHMPKIGARFARPLVPLYSGTDLYQGLVPLFGGTEFVPGISTTI